MYFLSSVKERWSEVSGGSGGRSSGGGRRVSWCPGVLDNQEKFGSLLNPVMINSHEVVNEKMVYDITIRLRDCVWSVRRRYSDFETFHEALLEEAILSTEDYPPLPKKRWFELNRWTQRNDLEYTNERRGELQKYLQALFKTNGKLLVQSSKSLHIFLEFNQLVDFMASQREMLSISEGESSPPGTTDVNSDFGCDSEDVDRNDEMHKSDQSSPQSVGKERSGSIFDMFSMSTGSEDLDSLPGVDKDTRITPGGLNHAADIPPLKSCLKESKYGSGDSPVANPEKKEQKTRDEARRNSGGIDAFEELKDFVKILIL